MEQFCRWVYPQLRVLFGDSDEIYTDIILYVLSLYFRKSFQDSAVCYTGCIVGNPSVGKTSFMDLYVCFVFYFLLCANAMRLSIRDEAQPDFVGIAYRPFTIDAYHPTEV
jgi:hypothetical protein